MAPNTNRMWPVTEEQRPRYVRAQDVEPGQHLWNPYGGPIGHFVVASQARPAPDGTVEFDAADGRTGRFRPNFHLIINWAAMDAQTEREPE